MIRKFLFLFVAVALILTGCVENPTDVGSELLPPSDGFEIKVVRTDTLNISQSSDFFKKDIDLGSASRIMLGKFNGLTSTALLRFYILMPDSVKDALNKDSLEVKDAWVEIKPNYYLGGKTNPFGFNVFAINQFWLPAGFNKDSLATLDFNPTPVSLFNNSTDSLFKFTISNALALDWLVKATNDEHPENNGVMLVPTDETQRIIGFQAITSIRHPDEPVLKIVVSKAGTFVDTLTENITSDVHVVTGTPNIADSTNINLLGNYSLRGYYYFDDSFLPNDAIINKAVLRFYIDSTASFVGSIPSDSLIVQMVADSLKKDSTNNSEKIYLFKRNSYYEGNISYFLQKWIDGEKNEGFLLRLSDESRNLNLVSLFSEKNANVTKRPLVIIYYTDKK